MQQLLTGGAWQTCTASSPTACPSSTAGEVKNLHGNQLQVRCMQLMQSQCTSISQLQGACGGCTAGWSQSCPGTLSSKQVAGRSQQGTAVVARVQQHVHEHGVHGTTALGLPFSAVLLCCHHVLQLNGQDAQSCRIIAHLRGQSSPIRCSADRMCLPRAATDKSKHAVRRL